MRYLVVDDDFAAREYFRDKLADYGSGETVAVAVQAIEFFRRAIDERRPFELVVMDAALPDMDATALTRALRCIEEQCGITQDAAARILVVETPWLASAHTVPSCDERVKRLQREVPIDEQSFLELVEQLTHPSPPQTQSVGNRVDEPAAPRFLIVDDDRLCRTLLYDVLSSHGDCDQAFDGEEAVRAVRLAIEETRPYELITLDIMMPNKDGHQALEEIRALEHANGIDGLDGAKVIMTTALSDSKNCFRAFREGCEEYLTKPIKEAALLGKLRELEIEVTEEVAG